MMRFKIFFLLIVVVIGFLGCSKEPALKHYSLAVPSIEKVPSSMYRSKSLKISYPQSVREALSEKMNFSYAMNDRGSYQNSQWSNDMSKLLQGTLIEVLDQSKLFNVVLSDTSTLVENYRLESNIFAFEHSVRDSQSHAVISIQFTLINADTGRLVKSKRFSYREATVSTDAQGYVAATNRAIKALSRDLLTWLLR